ncbi:MAG TPA: ABC transporter substrate-binding protein [Pseudolabrys sp.]|uniref:ABC transporter substrate-binding protein n=1 Tax=Pseudolabrys sp. TaxID=1960880 RepID=UPI002DDD2D6F|nr:ABC transporter substrate-binding protein [Pseudolabrys sp.]HEV2627173.1 ABC transporter substrate-binding protein [Pseudolabrys sp.]
MRKVLLAAGAALVLAAGPAAAQQKTVKIGFVSTFSGPVAAIGNDMRNSFELALDHMGRKMGGLPVQVIYEDDGFKPEVGRQKTEKLIESDKVDFVAGFIWSNVAYASYKPVVDAKTFLIISNAGETRLAGANCSPYIFSTAWTNDQNPIAVADYMNSKGVKSVYLIGPNYAAGKENLAGFKSAYKGKVLGEDYTTWPSQLDFSAELAKAKAAKPEAVYMFYPGAAGVQFLNQYAQAGLKGSVPLYTTFSIDSLSLPRQKDAAVGVISALEWTADFTNDANKKFVGDFKKKYGSEPSFYGAQSYDAAMLIGSAVNAVKGNLSDKAAVQKALEKADFKSVRGDFKFGPNHYPTQNFYMQEVVKVGDTYTQKTLALADKNVPNPHAAQCHMK